MIHAVTILKKSFFKKRDVAFADAATRQFISFSNDDS